MKKVMDIYGELALGLVVFVFLIGIIVVFFRNGTFSGMVEESTDSILGNTGVYEEHMRQAEPEVVWTNEKLPVGREIVLLSYMRVKTASSADWLLASNSLDADFTDFDVTVVTVNNVLEEMEEVVYDSGAGRITLTTAGIYQVNLAITDKENRRSGVTLRLIAE